MPNISKKESNFWESTSLKLFERLGFYIRADPHKDKSKIPTVNSWCLLLK